MALRCDDYARETILQEFENLRRHVQNVGRIIRLMHVDVPWAPHLRATASNNARPVRRPQPQLESLPAADDNACIC